MWVSVWVVLPSVTLQQGGAGFLSIYMIIYTVVLVLFILNTASLRFRKWLSVTKSLSDSEHAAQ